MWLIVLKQDVSFGLTFDLIDANLGLLLNRVFWRNPSGRAEKPFKDWRKKTAI
jgi:hypothetical protein